MDLLTDLQILQDLLDAASKRGVAVYLLLEENGLPHFLDMSSRLQISTQHLRVSENDWLIHKRYPINQNKENNKWNQF